ncbi:MAG: hypothetical protein JNL72_06440 [Flavipsychrobacter sp.]|nr:hypothetical protein [Flavipsychrobacter sp.]
MNNQQRNLASLTSEYKDNSKAAKGYTLLRGMMNDPNPAHLGKVAHLLRYHAPIGVYDEELKQRFAVDQLIEYYNLCFVGALAGFLPATLDADTTREIKSILGHHDVKPYYSQYYPYYLASVTLHYATHGPAKDWEIARNSTGLFYNFLMLNRSIKHDKDIEVFLNLLDHVAYTAPDGKRIADIAMLMNALKSKEQMGALLADHTRPALAKALYGFFKFGEFLSNFKTLLDKSESYPALQSAMWLYHGYYLDRLGAEVKTAFLDGFKHIADNLAANYTELFPEPEDEDDQEEEQLSADEQKENVLAIMSRMRDNILYVLQPRYKEPLERYCNGG